jgi:hypothetical protein
MPAMRPFIPELKGTQLPEPRPTSSLIGPSSKSVLDPRVLYIGNQTQETIVY